MSLGRISIEDLDFFLLLADEGSLQGTAQALHMSISNVSRRLDRLEEHANTRLMERVHGRWRLTAAGEMVRNFAHNVVHQTQELRNSLMAWNDPPAVIRLGTTETLSRTMIPSLVLSFHQKYPEILIKTHVSLTSDLLTSLRQRLLDFAIIPSIGPSQNIRQVPVGEIRLGVVSISPQELIPEEPAFSADIRQTSFLLYPRGCSYRHHFHVWCQSDSRFRIHELTSLTGMVQGVRQGLGVTVLPDLIRILHPDLQFNPLAGVSPVAVVLATADSPTDAGPPVFQQWTDHVRRFASSTAANGHSA